MLYTLAAVAIVQGFITLIDGLRAARHMRTFRPSGATRDRVIVFCPCKGIDSEFGKNIRSILGQDYPNFEARFVVESEADQMIADKRFTTSLMRLRTQEQRPTSTSSATRTRDSIGNGFQS